MAPVVVEGMETDSCCGGLAGDEQAEIELLRASALDRAAALSSYNNNSNNPQRGTDRLRGAW
jgi:hypothetical protein